MEVAELRKDPRVGESPPPSPRLPPTAAPHHALKKHANTGHVQLRSRASALTDGDQVPQKRTSWPARRPLGGKAVARWVGKWLKIGRSRHVGPVAAQRWCSGGSGSKEPDHSGEREHHMKKETGGSHPRGPLSRLVATRYNSSPLLHPDHHHLP